MNDLLNEARDWYTKWWLKVPEPRAYSLIYAFTYLGSIMWGTLIFFFPPPTLLGSAGHFTMSLMGILFVLGGSIAAVGGTREAWKLERLGIYSILMSLTAYGVVVLHTAFNSEGYRFAQMAVIYFSALLFLVRLVMIWRYSYKPRINSTGSIRL